MDYESALAGQAIQGDGASLTNAPPGSYLSAAHPESHGIRSLQRLDVRFGFSGAVRYQYGQELHFVRRLSGGGCQVPLFGRTRR
ncbi:MAG: hypothetical protein GY953_20660, partial [bacterium]|nr:hypothetical protein [bacterium]